MQWIHYLIEYLNCRICEKNQYSVIFFKMKVAFREKANYF
ncbi:hypothetical protein M23134_04523 [Microscilla marina ATCC 23134]|uniref:Uncharacterized protein n=1 Tax=Microscilla marina ATCC 23134 TaxID=313606 RepID=A1ZWA5_MICM2|nr:hypothetical protein M23134_04523 [Microscilla marina ATCC 23134]